MYGSDCLGKICEPVTDFGSELQNLIADLIITCNNAPTGVGIAASQIGVLQRVMIGVNNQIFVNPKIIELKGAERSYREGCLSIPGVYAYLHRPQKVKLEWQDENGDVHTKTFKGFEGLVIQHEYDHLEGLCFTDRLKPHELEKIEKDLNAIQSGIYPGDDFTKYPFAWD